jgi:hypothetical protein
LGRRQHFNDVHPVRRPATRALKAFRNGMNPVGNKAGIDEHGTRRKGAIQRKAARR